MGSVIFISRFRVH